MNAIVVGVVAVFFSLGFGGQPKVHHFVRRFTSAYAGQVVTVPGTFAQASAATFDPTHQVFYAFGSGAIFQVSLAGVATQLCSWSLPAPSGLAYDASNQLIYATATTGYAIYSLSLACAATLVAGGTRGTNDGQGSAAQFQDPTGIALDDAHQVLYVADVDRIRVVTVSGTVTTYTAPGAIGQYGYQYYNPITVGLSFDPATSLLYVADSTRNMIETINPRRRVQVVAGRCISLHSTTCDPMQIDGPRWRAGFAAPSGVVFNAADRSLYVTDSGNNEIRHLLAKSVGTLAGSGMAGKADGAGLAASFSSPQALAMDPGSGLLLVADQGNGLLRLVTTQGASPPPPPHGTIMYDPPSYLSGPNSICVTADGTVWFTEGVVNRIGSRGSDGKMHEFPLPRNWGYPSNMIVGPDGAAWFSNFGLLQSGVGAVARISSTGVITEYPVSRFNTGINALALGPDGNVWFTYGPYDGAFGYVTPGGQVHLFYPGFDSILTGFDGNMWTASYQAPAVYRYSTGGTLLNSYSLPQGSISFLANGPNQSIWFVFTSYTAYQIDELSIDGTVNSLQFYQDPGCFGSGTNLALGPDGNERYIWSEYCNGYQPDQIASLTVTGQTTLTPIFAARSLAGPMTFAHDGTLWFADQGANKIGKAY